MKSFRDLYPHSKFLLNMCLGLIFSLSFLNSSYGSDLYKEKIETAKISASKVSAQKFHQKVDKTKTTALLTSELGPEIGSALPHDLIDVNQAGGVAHLMGEKGLVIFFVRSLDWCPFCKRQAIEVSERREDFEERGLNVVFVSYDDAKKQTEFAKKENFAFAMLSDTEIEIINAFGLRNEKYKPSSRAYGIPHPAVFVVGKNKKILAKMYEEDYASNEKSYRNRPAMELILDKVDQAIQ